VRLWPGRFGRGCPVWPGGWGCRSDLAGHLSLFNHFFAPEDNYFEEKNPFKVKLKENGAVFAKNAIPLDGIYRKRVISDRLAGAGMN